MKCVLEKVQDCGEGTIVRNMNVKGDCFEISERGALGETFHLPGEYINNHEQNVGGNVGVTDHSGESSNRNEEQIVRNWRKGHPCYKTAKNLAGLHAWSSVVWKKYIVSNEIEYLPKEISK